MDCDTIGPISKLDIVWKVPVTEDTSSSILHELRMTDRGLLFSYVSSSGPSLRLLDVADSGRIAWGWSELPVDSYSSVGYHDATSSISIQNRGRMALINGTSGSTFKIHTESGSVGNPFGHILGDHYYYTWRDAQDTVAKLLRSHITDFQTWDTVYTVTKSEVGGSRPNIQSYNLWVNPETGDSILVFQHRMSSPNRVDVVAWNMTQRRVEWRHDNLTKIGGSSTAQFYILGDRAYFAGGTAFYCFNIHTGNIDWSHDHPSGINGFILYEIAYAVDEHLLIVKDGGDLLYAFRPETGQIAWQTKDAGQSSSAAGSPSYHEGIIYYCTFSRLYAVRADTGQVIWSERSPNRVTQPTFSGTVAIDPERGLLYACDRYFVMAIRLPE